MKIRLPHRDFVACCNALDNFDLLSEIDNVIQVLWVLSAKRVHPTAPGVPEALKNDDEVLRWEGYESALCVYLTMLVNESRYRGLRDMVTPYSDTTFLRNPGWNDAGIETDGRDAVLPDWF